MVLMWELIERMVYGCDLAKIGCCCLKTSPLLSRICQFSTIAAVDYCFESSFLNTIGEVQTKCQVKSSSLEHTAPNLTFLSKKYKPNQPDFWTRFDRKIILIFGTKVEICQCWFFGPKWDFRIVCKGQPNIETTRLESWNYP